MINSRRGFLKLVGAAAAAYAAKAPGMVLYKEPAIVHVPTFKGVKLTDMGSYMMLQVGKYCRASDIISDKPVLAILGDGAELVNLDVSGFVNIFGRDWTAVKLYADASEYYSVTDPARSAINVLPDSGNGTLIQCAACIKLPAAVRITL